jgi:uncharacterized membrane protein (DUF485 family)
MKKKHQQQVELHKNEGDSKSLSITILAIIIFLLSTGISYFLIDIFSREIIAKIWVGGTLLSIILMVVGRIVRTAYHTRADNYLEYKSKIKNVK